MAQKKGKLTVIYGPMFSGKTTYLIEKFGEGIGSVVFKPDLDQRYTKDPAVVSHDKDEIPAVLVNHKKPEEMLYLIVGVKKILIDEANFFSKDLVDTIESFMDKGVDVYVNGLVHDSERNVWGPMSDLIDKADRKIEMFARCDGNSGKCKAKATLSYRKKPNRAQVIVAGVEEYGACCEEHYEELHKSYKSS